MKNTAIIESAESEDASLSNPVGHDKIFEVEKYLATLPPADLHYEHHFANGAYARELHIPAGVMLTGRIHKFPQINILSKGDISVTTENGVQRVQAPFTVVSPAGTKRIAYTHSDCVWTTIMVTDLLDPEKIVETLTTNNEEEYLAYAESLKITGK